MNQSEVVFELLRWDEQEEFYRGWHLADDARRAELLADERIPREFRENVAHPEGIDPLKTEERFFASGRNVSLVKHPRYLPYFEHSHDFYEMICVLSGSCEQVLDGSSQVLAGGDVCLIAPGVPHGIEVMDDSLVVNVLIRSSSFLDLFQGALRDHGPVASFFLGSAFGQQGARSLVFHTGSDPLLRDAICDMYAEQQEDDDVADRIVCSLLMVFLARLARGYGDAAELTDVRRREPSELGDRMLAHVLAHAADVTLASLAREFHYSAPYCSRVVREASGHTFTELVTLARIERAMALLAGTQLSVASIGERVGYRSPETFIRAFERQLYLTPSQYRRLSAQDMSQE